MLCRKEEIQPCIILTCGSPWNTANECLAWCSLGSRRTFYLFRVMQYVCTLLHVFLLHDGSYGATVPEVHLVEAAYDKFTNDSICRNFYPRQPTSYHKWLQLSYSIWILYCSSCCLILRTFCSVLHSRIPWQRKT